MWNLSEAIDVIMRGAFDATEGLPCFPGCTRSVEDDTLHVCDALGLATTALNGHPVEVAGGGAPVLGPAGAVIYLCQRGMAADGRQPVTDEIAFTPTEALRVGHALIQLARQAGI